MATSSAALTVGRLLAYIESHSVTPDTPITLMLSRRDEEPFLQYPAATIGQTSFGLRLATDPGAVAQ